jgi:sugar lactone lactonase YvrE
MEKNLPTRRRLSLLLVIATALAALPGTALGATTGVGTGTGQHGTLSGFVPQGGMNVVLMEAAPGAKAPVSLGSARSRPNGRFDLRFRGAEPEGVKYLLATRGVYRLGLALGDGVVRHGREVIVDERSTVAMGFAMAQFIGAGDRVAGPNPGLRNSAAMSFDLVNREAGLSDVLKSFPNAASTSTLATFNSLGNLLTLCRRQSAGCARLLAKARTPGGAPASDTLAAVANIARDPWHNVRDLFRLSLGGQVRGHWRPSLGLGEKPDAWTLALRFEGEPRGMDGPGNFAIDAEGNLWVGNNYAYSRQSRRPACGSEQLFRFTPTGQTYPGSPYVGGGLSGVGFGVAVDRSDRVWATNFGFEGKGCETAADHFSASVFNLDGTPRSPEEGWKIGGISWPQGTVVDQQEQVWVANCGNDSVTRIAADTTPLQPTGTPPTAVNFSGAAITAGSGIPFERPFADAIDAQGHVFVTGNASNSVAELGPNGQPVRMITGGGLHLPMGVVADENGYVWVSNSRWVVAPCPGVRTAKEVSQSEPQGGGNVTLIKPDGTPVARPISSGGLRNPWGLTVDGDDHVWVANFGGRRLTELCGSDTSTCPPGKRRIGAAISPRSGYAFDGLVRNTGVAVDPSGNVWLANNWKNVPIQTNPGGYQIVAYLGLGAPTRSPQIGPPQGPGLG